MQCSCFLASVQWSCLVAVKRSDWGHRYPCDRCWRCQARPGPRCYEHSRLVDFSPHPLLTIVLTADHPPVFLLPPPSTLAPLLADHAPPAFPFLTCPLQAACSPEGLSSKHASQWLERLRPSLQHDNARDGVKGLLGALAECERGDPLRTLEAVEGFLVELRQVTHYIIYYIYTHMYILYHICIYNAPLHTRHISRLLQAPYHFTACRKHTHSPPANLVTSELVAKHPHPPSPSSLLQQIKAVLSSHAPDAPGSGNGANSPLFMHPSSSSSAPASPPVLSRREYRRVRQACKVLSEALQSLRTLLHYLHALGMWPAGHKDPGGGTAGSASATTAGRRPRSDSNLGLGLSPQENGAVWGEGVGGGIGAVLMGGRRGGEALIGAPARLVLDLGLTRVKGHYGSGLLFQVCWGLGPCVGVILD